MKSNRKYFQFIVITLFIFALFSSAFSQENLTESGLKKYLDKQEAVYEDICIQMGEAYWNVYTREKEPDLITPKGRYFELFGNAVLNNNVNDWYKKRERINDPVLKRRVEIWHNILTGARVNYDEEIFKLQSRLEKWLMPGSKAEDKPAADEMEKLTLQLMRLRNKKARELGYENYTELLMEITELDKGWFNSFVSTVESMTREPYRKMLDSIKEDKKKEVLTLSDIQKYFMQFYMNTQGPRIKADDLFPLMEETVENIGINFDALPARFVKKPMPPGIGGQGFAIDVPNDFRVVAMPQLQFKNWMHELGHGLQWMFCKIGSPILEGYEWCWGSECPAWAEGMAETAARFSENNIWQKKYAELTDEKIKNKRNLLNNYAPVYFRYLIATNLFEVELYKNLDDGPDEVAKRLSEKFLFMNAEVNLFGNLANMIYVSYPVYLQSYVIGDIISWQIHSTLEKEFGKEYAFNKNVGPFLIKNLYEKGELYPWQTKLEMATGKKLDVKGYLKSFGL